MQKIVNCLWFDNQAEEAANFYISIFKNGRVNAVVRYNNATATAAGKPENSVLTVKFEIEGQEFLALNGGPIFQFTPAISLMVKCDDQEELDHIWNQLSADPSSEQCGWLKDKYGISWQIVPNALEEMMRGGEAVRIEAVMRELMQMSKIDIKRLQQAFEHGAQV